MLKILKICSDTTTKIQLFIDNIDVTEFLAFSKGVLYSYDPILKEKFVKMNTQKLENWKKLSNQEIFDIIKNGIELYKLNSKIDDDNDENIKKIKILEKKYNKKRNKSII